MLNLTDLSTRRLTDDGALDWRPQWSPDSQRVYFESSRASGLSLWAVEVDGSQTTLVRQANGADLAWPYVGRILAFRRIEP